MSNSSPPGAYSSTSRIVSMNFWSLPFTLVPCPCVSLAASWSLASGYCTFRLYAYSFITFWCRMFLSASISVSTCFACSFTHDTSAFSKNLSATILPVLMSCPRFAHE